MISASQPLVYTGKSVFEHTLVDQYDGGYTICNHEDLVDPECHYNDASIGYSTNRNVNRTFLGHATDDPFTWFVRLMKSGGIT